MQEYEVFYDLCGRVEQIFEEDWRETDEASKSRKLEREKRAIMGFEKERNFFQMRIRDILADRGWENTACPPWYMYLTTAQRWVRISVPCKLRIRVLQSRIIPCWTT